MPLYPYRGIFPQIDPSAFVHPDAVVIGDVGIGPNASIWPGVVIRGDVNSIRIGACSNVQDGSILHVTRDSEFKPGGIPLIIEEEVNIAHSVTLHACTLKRGAMVGMGAIVLDGVVVHETGMLAAGSMATPGKQIASGQLWMGSPAKFARDLKESELRSNQAINANYIKLGAEYRQAFGAT
ncbi:gamma carbonic anhydrase family protein [Magnetofaba australis]|uniref:Putative hexapeptide repeat-containing transferase n=1 Tax=Magnetofaba australis IT-1 TaxID=1434232 RepID=A0A1Y2K4K5_9PROT|nr:gamma carbonic anhydrase family protein [Magnetofaba australis]OSM04318.1 putative hexapeptide repeat-containing transferase [Magnetofaba australis IT-1]